MAYVLRRCQGPTPMSPRQGREGWTRSRDAFVLEAVLTGEYQ
jgi:hypothetical protein